MRAAAVLVGVTLGGCVPSPPPQPPAPTPGTAGAASCLGRRRDRQPSVARAGPSRGAAARPRPPRPACRVPRPAFITNLPHGGRACPTGCRGRPSSPSPLKTDAPSDRVPRPATVAAPAQDARARQRQLRRVGRRSHVPPQRRPPSLLGTP